MKINLQIAFLSLVPVALLVVIGLAGCGKKEDTGPLNPTDIKVVSQQLTTTGTAPNIYITCVKGFYFVSSMKGGLVQVMNEDNKPMRCE